MMDRFRLLVGCAVVLALAAAGARAQSTATKAAELSPEPGKPATEPIAAYIDQAWTTLSRSMLECKSLRDPKVTGAPILYLPAGMAVPAEVERLHGECGVEIEHLPKRITRLGEVSPETLKRPGLLYLPNRYVVPGGRFNEMYGWDSYFIVLGLVTDRHTDVARGMVDNFVFEIENYGALLNANRTYFLTRSQPPLLAEMIREVHADDVRAKNPQAKLWLGQAYAAAMKDYALWTSPAHQAGETGLARYFDVGEGPVREMADDNSYYPDAIRWMLAHKDEGGQYLVPASAADAASCDRTATVVCAHAEAEGMRLSRDFYRGDRAMRESGFDPSFRFGAFSGSTHHYAPVCLNSLLYRYELDMAAFAAELGKKTDAGQWRQRAVMRKVAVEKYLWDGAQSSYVDYDFTTGKQSHYLYSTAFYPLWAGLASQPQAAAQQRTLAKLEQAHGLAMSAAESGLQWDLPFGWAPEVWFAVNGLRDYGFGADADRLAGKFRAVVEANYQKDGTIREKYDVVTGSAAVRLAAGYRANGVGFGWTNGVYVRLGPSGSVR